MSEQMLDEAVAVEITVAPKGKNRGRTHDNPAEHFVVYVEIVVSEATPLVDEDALVRVLGGIFRSRARAKISNILA